LLLQLARQKCTLAMSNKEQKLSIRLAIQPTRLLSRLMK
jgi:hypothetical protein